MLYTFYDTETSGLEVDCDILSFAYILSDENLNVKRAETLYFWKEGVTKWSEEAYEFNGLSKEFLRTHAADYEKNLRKMYVVLSYGDLVGYNSGRINSEGLVVGFDYPRCKSFLLRNGLYAPDVLGFYDVMIMYKQVYKKHTSLQKAFDAQGISRFLADAMMQTYFKTQAAAHDAAYDTVCTLLLFNHMYNAGVINAGDAPAVDLLHEVGTVDLEDYSIVFDDKFGISFRKNSDESIISAADFYEKYPAVYDRMLANPSAYM